MILDDLERLCAAATPAPWHQGGPTAESVNGHRHLVIATDAVDRPDANGFNGDPSLIATCESEHHVEAFTHDAAFIVAARDWLPKLIAVTRRAHGRYHTHGGVLHAYGNLPMEDCRLCEALDAIYAPSEEGTR